MLPVVLCRRERCCLCVVRLLSVLLRARVKPLRAEVHLGLEVACCPKRQSRPVVLFKLRDLIIQIFSSPPKIGLWMNQGRRFGHLNFGNVYRVVYQISCHCVLSQELWECVPTFDGTCICLNDGTKYFRDVQFGVTRTQCGFLMCVESVLSSRVGGGHYWKRQMNWGTAASLNPLQIKAEEEKRANLFSWVPLQRTNRAVLWWLAVKKRLQSDCNFTAIWSALCRAPPNSNGGKQLANVDLQLKHFQQNVQEFAACSRS